MKVRDTALKLCLSLSTVLVCLMVAEIGLRGIHAVRGSDSPDPAPAPLHVVISSPALYGLNPDHPEINSQQLRDDEVPVPRQRGGLRILVLGDSVAYGEAVAADLTFPNRLEALLQEHRDDTEVINAGVSGYTAYNELQYYLDQGRRFASDVVIVALSLNDVVNPRLHWGYTTETIRNIPPEAIPNPTYDRDIVQPRLARRAAADEPTGWRALAAHSHLYRFLAWRLGKSADDGLPDLLAEMPTHITGDDTISIRVLLDETSAEWHWLATIYDQLHAAVQADGATLVVALLPLAYQLDEDYPFVPQKQLAEHFRSRGLLCLDLLPALRRHAAAQVFLLDRSDYRDVWHLTERGHDVCARELLAFLQEESLFQERRSRD